MHPEETMLDRANRAVFANAAAVRNSAYAPKYHIFAPSGWINDPNGLVRFGGRYHVFYQHYPYAPHWDSMHWGHASSADLAHWRHEPVALAPDQPYESGCFSGSAVDDGGVLTLVYTAHLNGDPAIQTQCVARSRDGGRTFEKSPLNPVIPAYPPEGSPDFRDPKVWRQDGRWQMVVGSSHEGRGCALLYASDDLEHWDYRGVMAESDGALGSMWECPSFCRVDGWDVLVVSPMNMPGHKNIAMFGQFDCAAGRMTIDHWQDLDLGEHYYAAQVMEDGERSLLIGWMNMWGKPDPAAEHGWSGALTLPRVMRIENGRLVQLPAPELNALRGAQLVEGGCPRCVEKLEGNALEIDIRMERGRFDILDGDEALLSFCLEENSVSMTCGEETVSAPLILADMPKGLRIFVDRSSVECFANGGEVCFTQRIYPRGKLAYRASGDICANAWALEDAFEC